MINNICKKKLINNKMMINKEKMYNINLFNSFYKK